MKLFENYKPIWDINSILDLEMNIRLISKNHGGKLEHIYLKEYLYHTYTMSLDNHIIISGQNGMGKSLAAYWLASYIHPNFNLENIVFPSKSFKEFVEKMFTVEGDIVVVDEGDEYFNYNEHSTKEAKILDKIIKYLRWKRNIFIVCMKNIRETVHFYRKGKVNILIHLLNRYKTGPIAAVGAVLIGSHISDLHDKFDFSSLLDSFNFDDFVVKLEKENKNFVGYIEIPRLDHTIIQEYLKKKEENEKYLKEKYIEEINYMINTKKFKKLIAEKIIGEFNNDRNVNKPSERIKQT